jgi:LuxR family transcriptional regulator of spore coat protein
MTTALHADPRTTPASLGTSAGDPLTERERLVLGLLDQEDRTLGQIAAALYVSRNTIKSQVRSVYRKLGVRSRAEAVERARESGLVLPSPRRAPAGASDQRG